MKLKTWRKSQGLTQAEAVEAIRKFHPSITQGDWSNYENGRQMPQAQRMAAIQRLTGNTVTAVDFMPEESAPVEA